MMNEKGNNMSWDDYTEVEKLQCEFSDFHKSFYGYRPRYATPAQWRDANWLQEQITSIHDTMDKMKETFAGREELRAQGWVIEETDAQLAQQALWLQQERDREAAEAEARWEAQWLKQMQEADVE